MDKDQQQKKDQQEAAMLGMLMAQMYPASETILFGGCDDPECSCGGRGEQPPQIIRHDSLVG